MSSEATPAFSSRSVTASPDIDLSRSHLQPHPLGTALPTIVDTLASCRTSLESPTTPGQLRVIAWKLEHARIVLDRSQFAASNTEVAPGAMNNAILQQFEEIQDILARIILQAYECYAAPISNIFRTSNFWAVFMQACELRWSAIFAKLGFSTDLLTHTPHAEQPQLLRSILDAFEIESRYLSEYYSLTKYNWDLEWQLGRNADKIASIENFLDEIVDETPTRRCFGQVALDTFFKIKDRRGIDTTFDEFARRVENNELLYAAAILPTLITCAKTKKLSHLECVKMPRFIQEYMRRFCLEIRSCPAISPTHDEAHALTFRTLATTAMPLTPWGDVLTDSYLARKRSLALPILSDGLMAALGMSLIATATKKEASQTPESDSSLLTPWIDFER